MRSTFQRALQAHIQNTSLHPLRERLNVSHWLVSFALAIIIVMLTVLVGLT